MSNPPLSSSWDLTALLPRLLKKPRASPSCMKTCFSGAAVGGGRTEGQLTAAPSREQRRCCASHRWCVRRVGLGKRCWVRRCEEVLRTSEQHRGTVATLHGLTGESEEEGERHKQGPCPGHLWLPVRTRWGETLRVRWCSADGCVSE